MDTSMEDVWGGKAESGGQRDSGIGRRKEAARWGNGADGGQRRKEIQGVKETGREMVNGDMEGGQLCRRWSRVNRGWGAGRVTQEKGTEVGDKGRMERR